MTLAIVIGLIFLWYTVAYLLMRRSQKRPYGVLAGESQDDMVMLWLATLLPPVGVLIVGATLLEWLGDVLFAEDK